MNLLETESAYLAGFLDGDGCISISKTQRLGRNHLEYKLVVVLSQCNEEFLQFWQTKIGGQIYCQSSKEGNLGIKPLYQLRIYGKQAENLLRGVIDFLVIKKAQADVALKFRRAKDNPCHRKVTEEEWAVREECYQALRRLKQENDIV